MTSSYYSTYRKSAAPRAGAALFRVYLFDEVHKEMCWQANDIRQRRPHSKKQEQPYSRLLLLSFMERFRYFEDFCLCFCVPPWQLHAFGQPPQVPPQECFPFLRSLRMEKTIAAMIATTMIPTMTLPIEMPPFETSGHFQFMPLLLRPACCFPYTDEPAGRSLQRSVRMQRSG